MPSSTSSPCMFGLMLAETSRRSMPPSCTLRSRVEWAITVPLAVTTGNSAPRSSPSRLARACGTATLVAPVSSMKTTAWSLIRPVANAGHLRAARAEIDAVTVEPNVLRYIVAVCRSTRESPSLQLGVSPRGATWLLHASKAWAWLSGRGFVTPDEVKAVAKPCLRHRVMVRPELELEGTAADAVLDGILAAVPTPR